MTLSPQTEDVYPVPAPQSIRALLLDDSNFDRARIKRMASKTDLPITLDEVGSISEMDDAVRRSAYDLVLIDYRLPQGDGLMALDRIQQDPLNRDAGTIMITGNAGLDTAVTAMRNGCHDFLTKDAMDVQILRTAMMNAMSLAAQRRQMAVQAFQQGEIIRQGLTAALGDKEVQETVLALMRQTKTEEPLFLPTYNHDENAKEIIDLLSSLSEDDDFIVH